MGLTNSSYLNNKIPGAGGIYTSHQHHQHQNQFNPHFNNIQINQSQSPGLLLHQYQQQSLGTYQSKMPGFSNYQHNSFLNTPNNVYSKQNYGYQNYPSNNIFNH
jgi:hypothetical protein